MLMWSITKLDFLFYDFSIIYYDFFKDLAKINKKEKRQNLYSKNFVLAYHIICLVYRYTYVESNKNFILLCFCDLL